MEDLNRIVVCTRLLAVITARWQTYYLQSLSSITGEPQRESGDGNIEHHENSGV
jgi:hypothetical protein